MAITSFILAAECERLGPSYSSCIPLAVYKVQILYFKFCAKTSILVARTKTHPIILHAFTLSPKVMFGAILEMVTWKLEKKLVENFS